MIIEAQTYFVGIPIESDPVRASGSWMKAKEDVGSLKSTAEEEARKDAESWGADMQVGHPSTRFSTSLERRVGNPGTRYQS